MKTLFKICLVAPVLLTGCVNLDAPMSPDAGKFAETNFQAQVIDAQPAEGAPEMDAAMSAAAIERYRAGETKTSNESEEASSIELLFSPAN